MYEVLVGLIGFCAAIICALIAAVISLLKRNGRPVPNPPDPDVVKAGDMATSYWKSEFQRLHDKLDRVVSIGEALLEQHK